MRRAFLAVLAVLAASILVAIPAASASTTPQDLFKLKVQCYNAAQDRLNTLGQLTTQVAGSKHLDTYHRAVLNLTIEQDTTGLTTLQAKISADTDLATLQADCAEVNSGYRVLTILQPVVNIVIDSDRVTGTCCSSIGNQLRLVNIKLDGLMNAGACGGGTCEKISKSLALLQSNVRMIPVLNDNLAHDALQLTPAGYPGNLPTLQALQKKATDVTALTTSTASQTSNLLIFVIQLCNNHGC